MNLPEETYHQYVIECDEENEWEVKQAVDEYESARSVCLQYKKEMQFYRIFYLWCNFIYLLTEITEMFKNRLFLVAGVYLLLAVILVLWRKSLIGPAIASLMLILLIKEKAAFALIPVWVLFAFNGYMAYLHEKKQRYIRSQHGYPDFHPLEIKVKRKKRPLSQNEGIPAELEDIGAAKDIPGNEI